MKTNKYTYLHIIQQSYGQGWEDVSTYEANNSAYVMSAENCTLLRNDLREYKLLGYPTRVIKRKELN